MADDFMKMANALGNYRYEHFDHLSSEENAKLKELHSQTLSKTTELYTRAAVLTMDDVNTSLVKIETITEQIQEQYTKLNTVQNVLDRAASIVTLASSILTHDVNGIGSSLKSLLS